MKLKMDTTVLATLAALLLLGYSTDCARILVLLPIGTDSHYVMFLPLINRMAKEGHEFVVLTVKKSPNPPPQGVQEFLVTGLNTEDELENINKDLFSKSQNFGPFFLIYIYYKIINLACPSVLNSKSVQHILENEKHFDLILLDGTFDECVLGFVHKYKAPFILFSLPGPLSWTDAAMGNPDNPSYNPSTFLSYSDHMNFKERLTNTIVSFVMHSFRNYYYLPRIDNMARSHFGPDMPPLAELERNASLLFVDSHPSFSYPRPNVPAAIEVGGLHCRKAKPLPKDIEDFIAGSGEAGVIYFSMGTLLRSDLFPEKHRDIFLNTFAKLPQRILWKWDGKALANFPPNVKIAKWLPQQDILGHPKTKAFISHCGLFGTLEALYHNVPIVGLPFYGDQELNAQRGERAGYLYQLSFYNLTEETLFHGLTQVLNNPSYRDSARRVSQLMGDQPETPLERAMFWTEYVLRHKGARHLRSAALDLSWFQLHLLDVIAVIGVAILFSFVIIFILLRLVLRMVFGRKKNDLKLKRQ